MKATVSIERPQRIGAILLGLGAVAALAALVRGLIFFWKPALPETWDNPELWIDALLLIGGIALAGAGLLIRTRAFKAARSTPATFLTPGEEETVLQAIARFERDTSGEIRVHLDRHTDRLLMEEAQAVFEKLGMTATRERNGVLFFVSVGRREFAVLGDTGINEKVPPDFWQGVVTLVEERFRQGAFSEGLIRGIEEAGRALAAYFPPRADDIDELPNGLSRD